MGKKKSKEVKHEEQQDSEYKIESSKKNKKINKQPKSKIVKEQQKNNDIMKNEQVRIPNDSFYEQMQENQNQSQRNIFMEYLRNIQKQQEEQVEHNNSIREEEEEMEMEDNSIDEENQQFNSEEELSEGENIGLKKNNKRSASSLTNITQKLITFIQKQKIIQNNQCPFFNLNDIIQKIKANKTVQKRRIYDITNVLEGVGFMIKAKKNTVQWVGSKIDPSISKKQQKQDQLMKIIQSQHSRLDAQIAEAKQKLKQEIDKNQNLNFFHHNDLLEAARKINRFPYEKSLLVIVMPKGTSLKASRIDPKKSYEKIILQSQNKAQISLYVVNNNQNQVIKFSP